MKIPGKRLYIGLPWGLKQADPTESNSLIWTVNFQQYSIIEASDHAAIPSSRETFIIDRFHSELTRESNLRVILMCGPCVKKGRTYFVES